LNNKDIVEQLCLAILMFIFIQYRLIGCKILKMLLFNNLDQLFGQSMHNYPFDKYGEKSSLKKIKKYIFRRIKAITGHESIQN
jgi:hypothetical protein